MKRENNTLEKIQEFTTVEEFAQEVKKLLEVFMSKCKLTVQEVNKSNGLKLTGITITEQERNIAPIIYVDNYYTHYKEGRSMDDIKHEIISVYEKNRIHDDFETETFTDFDKICGKICFKLINAEMYDELLKTMPHRRYHDLAVVYYVLVGNMYEATATVSVLKSMLELWNVDENTLFAYAMKNTPHLLRGNIMPMSEMIGELLFASPEDSPQREQIQGENWDMRITPNEPLYIATNLDKRQGASVLLYENILKAFGEKIQSDFYILPSSIHETILVPVLNEAVDPTELMDMVRAINVAEVAPEEVLSDNIYYYSRGEGCVRMICS